MKTVTKIQMTNPDVLMTYEEPVSLTDWGQFIRVSSAENTHIRLLPVSRIAEILQYEAADEPEVTE